MATVNKTMKTFNVPNGSDTVCYEVVDDKGRKSMAVDWDSNSSSGFDIGAYVIKDGEVRQFTSKHYAGTEWNALETRKTNLAAEITTVNNAKIDKPTVAGTNGQVLRSDGNGGAVWADPATAQEIGDAVADWCDDHIPTGQGIAIDPTLSNTGEAADAKVVGDAIDDLENEIIISQNTPSAAGNKLWIKDQYEAEYTVPTMDDHNELKSAFNYISGNNLIGTVANVLYRIPPVKKGQSLTISRSDGTVFPQNSRVNTYDHNKTFIDYYTCLQDTYSRTINYAHDSDIEYIAFESSNVPLMVNFGSNPFPYVPYISNLYDIGIILNEVKEDTYGAIISGEVLGYANVVLSDANDAKANSIYRIAGTNSSYYPTHLPKTSTGFLITIRGKAKGYEQYFWKQYFADDNLNILYVRTRTGTNGPTSGTWGDWGIPYSDGLTSNPVLGYNVSVLADANNAKENSIYRIYTNDISKIPSHLPDMLMDDSYLITINSLVGGTSLYLLCQFVCDKKLNTYFRRVGTNNNGTITWQSWEKVINENAILNKMEQLAILPADNLIDPNIITSGYYVDFNSGARGGVSSYSYATIPVSAGDSYKIVGKSNTYQVAFFSQYYKGTTTGYISGVNSNSFTAPEGAKYATVSFQHTTDNPWCNLASLYVVPMIKPEVSPDNVVYRITSSDNMTEGIIYAQTHGYRKIVVEEGEYDIISEFKELYGNDYFDNYAASYDPGGPAGLNARGIWLENVEITFSQGAKVICHYTGDNENVKLYFSAFATGNNVSIKGLIADSSEVRYTIHADFESGNNLSSFYMGGCDLHNNRTVGSDGNRSFGAGLGQHSNWIIEDCIFRSDGANAIFSIHTNSYAEASSRVVIKDCYFEGNGYMDLHPSYSSGDTTIITVTGCCWKTDPAISQNAGYQVLSWGNTKRD